MREGVAGQTNNPAGEYSSGRGGAGNIVPSPRNGSPAPQSHAGSADNVPEMAMREPGESYENFHTGRGGQGNVHKDKYGGHSSPQKKGHSGGDEEGGHEGLLEKAKHAMSLGGGKKREESPLKNESER